MRGDRDIRLGLSWPEPSHRLCLLQSPAFRRDGRIVLRGSDPTSPPVSPKPSTQLSRRHLEISHHFYPRRPVARAVRHQRSSGVLPTAKTPPQRKSRDGVGLGAESSNPRLRNVGTTIHERSIPQLAEGRFLATPYRLYPTVPFAPEVVGRIDLLTNATAV